MADLAEAGISKDQRNEFDKYQFRGIDDVYNALAPLLAKHKLVIVPQSQECEVVQIKTSQGKPANHAKATINYALFDAESESNATDASVTATVVGEASDRGDKAINKAFSAAYKLFVFQLFCVPTQGSGKDSEEESIEHAVPSVGEVEIAQIRELLEVTSTDEGDYLKYLNMQSLEQIPLSDFAQVIGQLNRKHQRMESASREDRGQNADYEAASHGE
jgi:hypothetical protein